MTVPRTLSVEIPGFPGFYESELSDAIDREADQWLEYRTEELGETGPDFESNYPAPLQLADRLGEMLWRHTRFQVAYHSLARTWLAAFDYHAGELLGLTRPDTWRVWTGEGYKSELCDRPSIGATFEDVESPREYNFTSDRLFGKVPLKTLRELFKRSAAERHESLARIIAERHSSRSGFVSFYSDNVRDWIRKPLREWDHNEYGTLILAALMAAGADLSRRKYYAGFWADVRGTCLESETASDAFESAVDWAAFDRERAAARVDRLAAWFQADGPAAQEWARAHPDHVREMRNHAGAALAAVLGETPGTVAPSAEAGQ